MDYNEINKQNIEKWKDALFFITKILNTNNISYYLSASGLKYILGSSIYPYDIDIFTSRNNVKKAYKLVKKYSTSTPHYWREDNKKLLEFQGTYNDIPFEICEWESEPKKLKIVKLGNLEISIL